jgi:predicted transcriptional regulator
MQKVPHRGSLTRAQKSREVLSGYPRCEPFKTRTEIEEYVSADEIECLLCGRAFKNLGIHLKRIHQMYPDDYRYRYNIPAHFGLVGKSTSDRMSANSSQPDRIEFVRRLGKKVGGKTQVKGRKCDLVISEQTIRMKENGAEYGSRRTSIKARR